MDSAFLSKPSQAQAAAVAALTAKERECLERWLSHATAKEIARDLSITHHAVEKRLKSARQKLGVASSLEAARLLATIERGGRSGSTGYGAAELPDRPNPSHRGAHGQASGAGTAGGSQSRPFLVPGVIAMSLIVATALLAAMQSDAIVETETRDAMRERMSASAIEQKSPEYHFADLDADNSNYLEPSEIAAMRVIPRVPVVTDNGASFAENVANGVEPTGRIVIPDAMSADADGDGRIALEEFRRWYFGIDTLS